MNLQPGVIYPWGPLLDLLPTRLREYRVYAIEFAGGVVKVGRSKNPVERMKQVVKDASIIHLSPVRFLTTSYLSNAGHVEQDILRTLRAEAAPLATPDDFPARTEWLVTDLDRVRELLGDWVECISEYGHPIALRSADLRAKAAAEAITGRLDRSASDLMAAADEVRA